MLLKWLMIDEIRLIFTQGHSEVSQVRGEMCRCCSGNGDTVFGPGGWGASPEGQQRSREAERSVSTEVPSTHTSTNELRGVEIHTMQDSLSLNVYSQINTYFDSYDLKLEINTLK